MKKQRKICFRSLTLLLFLIIPGISFSVSAQQILSGHVESSDTGQPLEGASVYFNNTSIGTSTSAAGDYKLYPGDIQSGELVVSIVGYEREVVSFTSASFFTKQRNFKLTPKPKGMEAILVMDNNERRKNLALFVDNFLGVTKEASRSKIENLKDIFFIPGPNGPSSFSAKSDAPLIIVNKLLGYRISFDLERFDYDKSSNSTAFYGFTKYESTDSSRKISKHRKSVYYGSTMHFFRCLMANQLEKNYFEMFLMKTIKMKDSDRKMIVLSKIPVWELMKFDTSANLHALNFKDPLVVRYMQETPTNKYLKVRYPFQIRAGSFSESTLRMLTPLPLFIDKSGLVTNPLDYTISGYWSFEKAANLLPFDYSPDE